MIARGAMITPVGGKRERLSDVWLDIGRSLDSLPANAASGSLPALFLSFGRALAPLLIRVRTAMAKAASLKIKLLSTADTGYFYVTKKNARTKTEKLAFKKYDPVARKHVEFKETKIK